MAGKEKYPVLAFAIVVALSAVLAAVSLWVFSKAQRPFDYMVAGTMFTSLSLVGVFVVLMKRRML
jgi:hypothetical protein